MPTITPTNSYQLHESPLGTLLAEANDAGEIIRLEFVEVEKGVPARARAHARGDANLFAPLFTQLDAYFAGELHEFSIPTAAEGSPFQHRAWAALRDIPFGSTASYGEIATEVGSPQAARAIGLACARNPIVIVVPCHRVLGANGGLTGFAAGIERKRSLLELEQSRLQPRLPGVEPSQRGVQRKT